jgi:ubiquinone/menaquinone biosynthesis C-methylase UbiE
MRPAPDPTRIVEQASAFFESCVLFAASDLGIFGALARLGSADHAAVAEMLGLDERGARLLLDACVAVRLLSKQDGLYSNTTESAAFLVPGGPGDMSNVIRYNRDVYAAWGRLADLGRHGGPVEPPQLHLGDDPARTRTFVLSLHHRALAMGRVVLPHLDLAGRKKLLDVGGGPGTFSVLIAQANPAIQCTVLDLPPVVEIAQELITKQGMSERVGTMPGDYHTTPFPSGLDIINFFGMLHQEPEDSIRDLLLRAHEVLEPGGVVYVLDMMTDETYTSPKFSALFAVNMALTTNHGWVFSDQQLKGWMQEAGLVDFQVSPLPPPMPHWLAMARKPHSQG